MDSVMDNTSDINQTRVEAPVIQAPPEKMIPQSQVNEIVGNVKREAAEKAVEAYRRQQAQVIHNQPQEAMSSRYTSEDDVKRVANDEFKKHFSQLEQQAMERANADAANRIVTAFKDKISAGKDQYEDFESVTGNVAMQFYPNVVQLLAEHVDNSADVLYHLAKNRDKLYRIESLSAHNSPDAIYEIKRLAESIKANANNTQVKNPNSPLSQQRPSTTGTDSGSLSWSDLKQKYKG